MAGKAKKIHYLLELQTNAEYVEKEIKLINSLLKDTDGTELYSPESIKSLQTILSTLKQTDSVMKEMDQAEFFDPTAFKETSKVISNLQKQITSITKGALKEFAGRDIFDTEEIQKYTQELEETEGKVKDITKNLVELQKQQQRTMDFGTQDAIEQGIRTIPHQKKTTYMGGDNTPFGNLKTLKDANKALEIAKNKVEETQQAYNEIHKIQNKTAGQQKKEAQLEKELKIYTAVKQNLEEVLNADTKIQQKIDEQNAELEEQKANVERITALKKEAEAISVEDARNNQVVQETQELSNTAESHKLDKEMAIAADNINKTQAAHEDYIDTVKQGAVEHEKGTKAMSGFLGKFISSQIIFQKLKQLYSETVRTIQDLDAAFNGIAIVSSMTTEQVWQQYDAFSKLAKQTGFTVKEISNLSLEYFRQGKTLGDVIKLTEAAASAAKVAGITAEESVRYLTAAVNGYRLSADQAMMVSDKFAALAAASATDYDGLATALSKVSAQAYTVGVDMDSMLGYIAKVLEVTQEAPENIGTALTY